ncbi:hypothetical protein C1N79_35825 (plasmid) [Streptomyces sp. SGAir0924]|nr:hypothetical protein C1N79_35825 [Streptomyces sp. SGAir0924]
MPQQPGAVPGQQTGVGVGDPVAVVVDAEGEAAVAAGTDQQSDGQVGAGAVHRFRLQRDGQAPASSFLRLPGGRGRLSTETTLCSSSPSGQRPVQRWIRRVETHS